MSNEVKKRKSGIDYLRAKYNALTLENQELKKDNESLKKAVYDICKKIPQLKQ